MKKDYSYKSKKRALKTIKKVVKYLLIISKCMLYYSRLIKRLITILIVILLIFISLSLRVKEASGVDSSTVVDKGSTTSDISQKEYLPAVSNGKAGGYIMPDPCALSDVICKDEVKSVNKKKHINTFDNKIDTKSRVSIVSAKDANKLSPIKKNATVKQQTIIDYAWSISKSKDFIYTLEVENAGSWDVNKLSYIVGSNGYRDKGLCQINIGYHPEIVSNKKFTDYKWQLDQCWKLFKGGTRFYGFDHRARAINKYTWIENKDFKAENISFVIQGIL